MSYQSALANPKLSRIGAKFLFANCRQVATLNGLSQLVEATRISGIDVDNLDIEIEGYLDLTSNAGTMWSQNTLNTFVSREFHIFVNGGNTIQINLGGQSTLISIGATVREPALWGVRLVNTTAIAYKNGVQIGTGTVTIGASREPTATFKVNARGANAGVYGFFLGGESRDHKVWVGGDRNTGTLVLDMPIDDGFISNPVIRNAADPSGLTDGVAVNFTSDTWSEVCE